MHGHLVVVGAIVLVDANKKGVVVNNGQNIASSDEGQTESAINIPDLSVAKEAVKRDVILDYETLRRLIKKNANFKVLISENEIEDKAKGDFLTKTIAVFQVSWFVAQCVARFVQGLAVTELEVVTLALASLNGIMCAFWWSKPLGLRVPFKVPLKKLPLETHYPYYSRDVSLLLTV